MGVDFHALNFLRHVHRHGPFGKVVTIGRQELHVNPIVLASVLGKAAVPTPSAFCENLLVERFGASVVESLDACAYEGATHIVDMGQALPPELADQYDTVIDCGTSEHIFDAPQALENCARLCRPGGQIVHVLPANGYCGHGFWQFSPELFFSLYSEVNGYRDTEVYLADFTRRWRWWQVHRPEGGRRVNVRSLAEVYVMVRTRRVGESFSHTRVQQSDYVHEWDTRTARPEPMAAPGGLRGVVMRSGGLHDAAFAAWHQLRRLRGSDRLTRRNPGLTAFDVRRLP